MGNLASKHMAASTYPEFGVIFIERELDKILGKKVDFLTKNSLSKYIRERIIKEAKPIYERR